MTHEVSTKEVSERTSQQWGPLGHTCLIFKDLEQERLRRLYSLVRLQQDISRRTLDLVRELEQSLEAQQ